MAQDLNIGLNGAFKVDLYDASGSLINEGEWFNNFITQSGLRYPLTYSFADCFRYLSLGDSSAPNDVNTTGLSGILTGVNHALGSQPIQYMGRSVYHVPNNQGSLGGCGTIATQVGPLLYRAWEIPTGTNNTLTDALAINEFMVSPSSGQDTTGRYAFSRVTKSITIPVSTKAVISYRLNLRATNTGVNVFDTGTFLISDANIDNDGEIVTGWRDTSGYYKQIYHGFRMVDKYGSTFNGPYGDAMEPCLVNTDDMVAYFSPDIGQFAVNPTGGKQSSAAASYLGDGLSTGYAPDFYGADANRYAQNITEYMKVGDLDPKTIGELGVTIPTGEQLPVNIRFLSQDVPNVNNYRNEQTVSYQNRTTDFLTRTNPVAIATVGASGLDSSYLQFGDKFVRSSLTVNLPYEYTGGRSQVLKRKIFFPPVNSQGWNNRLGSFVIGYSAGEDEYYPYVDGLLVDSSGRATPQRYRVLSGFSIGDGGSGVGTLIYTADGGLGNYKAVGVTGINGTVTGSANHGSYVLSSNPDYGIADHSLNSRTEPAISDPVYYPSIHGSQIGLVTDTLIYQTDRFQLDASGYPNFISNSGVSGYRLIDDILFYDTASSLMNGNTLLRASGTPVSPSGDGKYGFYLFRSGYDDLTVTDTSTTFKNDNSGIPVTKAKLYIAWPQGAGSGLHTIDLLNHIQTGIHFDVETTDDMKNVNKLARIFSGANNDLTGRGIDAFITGGDVRVSGFEFSGTRADLGTVALYLNAVSGDPLQTPNRYYVDGATLVTTVDLANFSKPSGSAVNHAEAYRLLPNHGQIQASGSDSYPLGEYGGAYPAMSYDNTLELFVNINWSSTCGGVAGCVDP